MKKFLIRAVEEAQNGVLDVGRLTSDDGLAHWCGGAFEKLEAERERLDGIAPTLAPAPKTGSMLVGSSVPAVASSSPPLDGFQLDDVMAMIFMEEWNKLCLETKKAPPDLWLSGEFLCYQPHLWTARIAGRVDELIAAEVENRLEAAMGRAEVDRLIQATERASKKKAGARDGGRAA